MAGPGPPVAGVTSIESAPTIDGDVLNDPAYADVTPGTGFIQNTPDEGQPASQMTEIYVVHTADTLYFGIVCYDDDPSRIIVAGSRRDEPLGDQDSLQIILDTYRDQQTAFLFGTNPAGIEYDGQVTQRGGRRDVFGRRFQQELGRFLGGQRQDLRDRMDRGIRDSVQDRSDIPGAANRPGP